MFFTVRIEEVGHLLPPAKNVVISTQTNPPPAYSPPTKLLSHPQSKVNSLLPFPLNNNFQVGTQKRHFQLQSCSCTVFVLIPYSLDTQVVLSLILIDVQYSQKAVFSFKKRSNQENHSSLSSHHPVKKNSPRKIYHDLESLGWTKFLSKFILLI